MDQIIASVFPCLEGREAKNGRWLKLGKQQYEQEHVHKRFISSIACWRISERTGVTTSAMISCRRAIRLSGEETKLISV
jgi:hypothetical protein